MLLRNIRYIFFKLIDATLLTIILRLKIYMFVYYFWYYFSAPTLYLPHILYYLFLATFLLEYFF